MELKPLHIKNKLLFDKFFNLRHHELSVYAFLNVYIWKGLFDIYWAIIHDSLCIFFKDRLGCFLYLSPPAERSSPQAITAAFEIMDKHNKKRTISRIENIEEKEVDFYKNLGYVCTEKFPEYLCQRRDLVQLRGNRFKSKRACVNYFQKHYHFEYCPFAARYRNDCLKLYDYWMGERQEKYKDIVYQGMLGDSRKCLEVLLDNFGKLNFNSGLVKIDNRIKAFTFGFSLSRDTFCILYEISDLSIKGLSQYVFRRFSAEQKSYHYVNIMDDSGLENLRKVKLSYHPVKLVPAYIATRQQGSF
jgi:hypothetical protein